MRALKSKTSVAVIIAAVSVLYAAIYLFLPYFFDDLWYIGPYGDYVIRHQGNVSWTGIVASITEHYNIDNIRLANIAFVLLTLIPKWLTDCLNGAVVGFSIYMFLKISGYGMRSASAAVMAVALWMFGFIWGTGMWCTDYVLNYVWSGALTLVLMYIFIVDTNVKAWAAGVLALVLGMWHEGFGVPLLVGVVVVTLLYRRQYLTRKTVCIIVGLVVGTLYLRISPGSLNRLGRGPGLSFLSFVTPLKFSYMLVVYLALLAVCVARGRLRSRLDKPLVVLLTSITLASYGVHVLTNFTHRISWCASLTSIVGVLYCGRIMLQNVQMPKLKTIAVGCVAMVAAVHGFAVAYNSYRTGNFIRAMQDGYESSADGLVGIDDMPHDAVARLALLYPGNSILLSSWSLYCYQVGWEAQRESDKYFRPVPKDLLNVTAASGVPAKGEAGLRIIDGHMFLPVDSIPYVRTYKYANGPNLVYFSRSDHEGDVVFVPFRSRGDGKMYFSISPSHSYLETLRGEQVTGFTITE